MTVLRFSLNGQPIGKGRPRARVRGDFAQIYTPDRTRKYELAVARAAVQAMDGRPPFEGAVSLSLQFRLAPPKSLSKKQRSRVLGGEVPYFGAADLDNYVKAICDAFNGVVFADDKQIMRLFATKVAAETAGVDVRLEHFG